ncbi:interferon-induced very large GTPase 1-like [Scomber scombrus]|uniref:Interferon-induced very large GTPase 1-like n=1 Tax=Scomber scombrus TaxID=13677 RepID=A0AAV1PV45_SCOSC
MGLKDKGWADVCEELKGIIGKILSGPHTSFQLETMAEVSGIRVDEDDIVCRKGKTAAMKIVDLLKGMDVSKIKDKYLPCQGQLWHDWCKINKEQYRLKGNIEMEKCRKQEEMKKKRQEQCSASCSELMRLFIESLSSLLSEEKEYFLKWIQILLDALSTDDLSSILQNYDEKWSEVLTLKKKHDKSDQLTNEVIEKLGDQRVFVLSVLGVQSSGKSTMLNAMFGLQFAVSAGRCTKGAFMQLVKVSEEKKKDFKFDYVLVVDTEGLHALELAGNATLHHDNELATFVVGLGNMTLINIFGENPADMQDVLQIVVQAFMRMKKVKLSPTCVFVHQNVSDIGAAEKNMDGKRRLQEKLDQMAKLAAKEEVCDAECFNDIIKFDVQKDVKYFAQLWEGSPPMAPPDYISKTHMKLQCTENSQYGNWTWALRSYMLTIENQLHTRIENGKLDKIELNDLHKEMSKTYGEVKKDMKKYFDDDRDKEMLVQWRGRFESKIKEFHDEQVRGVKRKLDEVIQQKKACKKMDDKKTEFENKLLQKSKELAHQLKDKAKDEKELQKQFNNVWRVWVTELTGHTKPIEDIKLEDDLLTILQSIGIEWSLINDSKINGSYKNISKIGDYGHYVIRKKNQNVLMKVIEAAKTIFEGPFPHEEQKQIRTLIEDVEKQSLHNIKSKPVATRGYSPTYLQEVTKNVKEKVTEFESKRKYALKKEFTLHLLLYVFDKAGSWISESHNKFKMNNDAVTFVESKKMQYYNIFRSFCKGNSSAVVLGEMICEKLKVSTVKAACNKTAIDLAGEIRCSFSAFSGNRSNLEKHVLISLAEKEDFDGFINYIRHPRSQAECFIKKVEKYIFTDNKAKAKKILKKNVEDINKLMTFDTISSENFSDINKFDFLAEEIEKGLPSIIKELSSLSLDKMKEFRLKPDQILIDQQLNCCWVKCPFCAAVCTNTIKDHSPEDNSVPFHRPSGINGWHKRNTVELCINFCTTNVASDRSFYPRHDSDESIPYKVYRTGGLEYANWRITPDESKLTYWKWFVCQFQKQLEDHYNLKFQGRGEIPKEWKTYSKEEAIKSLDEMCPTVVNRCNRRNSLHSNIDF